MPTLIERGFVEKRILKPEKYCAIQLKSIIKILDEKKTEDKHKIEDLTTQVLLENNNTSEIPQLNNISQFVLIPKKKQLENRVAKAFFNSKKSISMLILIFNQLGIIKLNINKEILAGM